MGLGKWRHFWSINTPIFQGIRECNSFLKATLGINGLYSRGATICSPDDLSDCLGILGLRKMHQWSCGPLSSLPHLGEADWGKINIYIYIKIFIFSFTCIYIYIIHLCRAGGFKFPARQTSCMVCLVSLFFPEFLMVFIKRSCWFTGCQCHPPHLASYKF